MQSTETHDSVFHYWSNLSIPHVTAADPCRYHSTIVCQTAERNVLVWLPATEKWKRMEFELSAHRVQPLTFRTRRRSSLHSIFCNWLSLFASNSENFQSRIVLSIVAASPGCCRVYSLLNTFSKLSLNSRWSGRRHIRRFGAFPFWLLRNGDRRIFVLLIFGHTGLTPVVVVLGIGFPWPSEHQQPEPPMHWTAAYVPSERHRGTNFFGDDERWAIAYARDFRHSVYE